MSALSYTFKGFPEPNLFRFLFGVALLAANASMMFVNLEKPTVVLVHLDQVKFPAIRNFSTSEESFYTYKGRLIIDAVSTFWLFFFIGKSFLALLTMALIGGATVLKTQDIELFQELFRDPGTSYGGIDASIEA